MKKILLSLILCLSIGSLFAQSAEELKNAGNTAFEAKDYKKALDDYEKAIAAWGNQPQNHVMLFNAGAAAYKLKQYPKAVKYFDMVIAGNTETEPAYLYKAMALKQMKKTDDCIKTYEEGIAKNPDSKALKDDYSKYLRAESKIHLINGNNLYKATVAKVNAQKLKPTDAAYTAETYKAKKEINTAIELIDKSLAINPDDADSKQVKATCEQSLRSIQ
jgi:pilus assembly protein Flp/PilA